MQVGDKKKAGVLSVVAVGAVGFLIFQLVPKAQGSQGKATSAGPTASVTAATPAPDTGASTITPVADPTPPPTHVTLDRDPFAVAPRSKPKPSIAPAPKGDEPDASAATSGAARPAGLSSDGQLPMAFTQLGSEDSLPNATPEVPRAPRGPKTTTAPGPKPPTKRTIPAPATALPESAKVTILLLGVVEAPTTVAMIRIGDAERTAHVGDELLPGLRIESISLAGLTFFKRPGVRLAPGEEIRL